jgi:hypothetical protein
LAWRVGDTLLSTHAPRFNNMRRLGVETVLTMRKPMLVVLALGCLASLYSAVSTAGELSALAGHYRYEQYNVTLPNGRVLALKDLGATDAFLDISDTGSITLRMTMRAGNTVTETAKVIEAHFAQGRGYWIAQWPDMSKPVRAQIKISGNTLTSDTSFDDRSDIQRYGSVEHAVLRKATGN